MTAGERLAWVPPDPEARYDLVQPDRSRVPLGSPSVDAGGNLTLTTAAADVAGVYRFAATGGGLADPESGTFAVAADLLESENLELLSDAEAAELLGFRPVLMLAGPDAAGDLATERGRREWTVWVLLALFAVAIGESAWAWFCGKAW